ncbi:MAG: type II toxin-antitoxin system RelE/ParE family toxin [Chromatiales bacterium]|nr:type II toxin-antitoxin system RelE/ParE family toxin [Gammaproteobacteria bacterium]
MRDELKKLQAVFYRSPSGSEPVREWLKELFPDDRRIVGHDIGLVEFAWPVGMPACRPLRDGLREVRSNLTDGKNGRVIFCIIQGKMVLLLGFIKKTQKTPNKNLKLALKRMKDVAS